MNRKLATGIVTSRPRFARCSFVRRVLFFSSWCTVANSAAAIFRRKAAVVCTVSLSTAATATTAAITATPTTKARSQRRPTSIGFEGAVGTVGALSSLSTTFWNTCSDTVS